MTRRILIVDAQIQRRERIAAQLEQPMVYTILQAAGPDDALKYATQCDMALIYHEPVDAFTLFEAMQTQQLRKPVIFLTETGSEELAVKAYRMGFSDYLSGHVEIVDLLATIWTAMGKHLEQEIIAGIPDQLLATNLQLSDTLQGLDTLVDLGKSITADLNIADVLDEVVTAAVSIMQADKSGIWMLDKVKNVPVLRSGCDMGELVSVLTIEGHERIVQDVVDTGEPFIIQDASMRPAYLAHDIKGLACVPMRYGRKVIGVLGIANHVSDIQYTPHHIKQLTLLADFASIAYNNADAFFNTQSERNTLNAILASTDDVVLVVDTLGEILFFNPTAQRVFSITRGYKGSVAEAVDHDDVLALLKAPHGMRTEIVLSDDRIFTAQVSVIPGVGRALTMHDISYLKEVDRLKTNFVSNVSQDLRSPLTAILGYVELLSRAGAVNQQQQLFIDRIIVSAQSISNLITDLLDLSRIESGTLDVAQEQISLPRITEYAIAVIENQANARGQTIAMRQEGTLPFIQGNGQRLKQMVRHMLQNAIQYTPEGGKISVTLRHEASAIVLQVKDTGIGIPPEDQPHIFEKFYRSESVRDTYEGAGLGLSIVKSIVDRHNGRIWVESRVNEGTTFTVIMPTHTSVHTEAVTQEMPAITR